MPEFKSLTAIILSTAAASDAEREQATSALEDYGPPAESDAAQVAKLLSHGEGDVVYWAATLLGRLEGKAAPYTSELVQVLDSSGAANARERAAWALGKIGPGAKAALPSLTAAAAAQDPRLARLANQAVAAINK